MVLMVVWILFAIGAAIAASNKGRSGIGWFLLGIPLGPFALLFALLVAYKQPKLKGGLNAFEQWAQQDRAYREFKRKGYLTKRPDE
jgi:hypothetical protein